MMWRDLFTICGNCRLPVGTRAVVDLCCRLFPCRNAVCSPSEVRLRDFFTQLIQIQLKLLCNLPANSSSLVNASWRHTNQDVDWPTSLSLKQLANASFITFNNIDRPSVAAILGCPGVRTPQDLSKGVSRNGGTPQDLATLIVIVVDLGNESTLRR